MGVVGTKEYCTWRGSGNAISFQEEKDVFVNHSLATVQTLFNVYILYFIVYCKGLSGIKEDRRAKWGYFSDIMTGPFICHGVYTEDSSFYQKNNMRYIKVCF